MQVLRKLIQRAPRLSKSNETSSVFVCHELSYWSSDVCMVWSTPLSLDGGPASFGWHVEAAVR